MKRLQRGSRGLVFSSCAVLMFGCRSEPSAESDDDAVQDAVLDAEVDSRPEDAVSTGTEDGRDETGEGAAETLGASDYCEATVTMFCPYYLRCGRMAVDSLEACERTFLEACNARYEPLYADLEARGLLKLSAAGIEQCRSRLESVACEAQIFDLDGCSDVWLGQAKLGEACGPGLESFICGEDATCLIDLSFCGKCVPLAGDGPCDLERRCPETSVCRDGVCVARASTGEACDEARPCVLGASCDEVCKPPEVVGLGETCGGERRCPYKAACVSGRCAPLALIGEACGGEVGCASGYCDDGRCRAFEGPAERCESDVQCQSGRCDGGLCGPIGWSCQPE
jgi:hypothetical protein